MCGPGLRGLKDGGCRRHHEVHLILPFLLAACECHPQGSLTTECALLGGQCCCHPNIDGRTCDHCRPGTCGFRPTGCRGEPSGPVGVGSGVLTGPNQDRVLIALSFPTECCCHTKGATNAICNPVNGQCPCRAGLAGRCCDHCLYGWWGFPCCQPCACSGAAELCHPLTGVCQDCHGATMDQHCER